MLEKIKKIIKQIILPSNKSLYYGRYQGSVSNWRLLLWNLRHPGRLYNRFRYGQLFKINSMRKSSFKKKLSLIKKENVNNANYNENQLSSKLEELLNTGGVVISNYFSEDKIEKFTSKYESEISKAKNFKPIYEVENRQNILPISEELIDLWIDPILVEIISSFYGRRALSRNYPSIIYTLSRKKTDSRAETETNSANFWHVDHSVLFNLHILLEDLSAEDAHMEYIPGSHKIFNSVNSPSDEVVKKIGKEPIKCFGKKGTIYMHEGNTLHKLKTEHGESDRLALHLEFTAGSNVLLDCNNISKCLSSGYDLKKLDKYKRDVLRGIFPKSLEKGYEISDETISPTKFKGI